MWSRPHPTLWLHRLTISWRISSFPLDLRLLYWLFSLPERLLSDIPILIPYHSVVCSAVTHSDRVPHMFEQGSTHTVYIYIYYTTVFQQMAVKYLEEWCLFIIFTLPYWLALTLLSENASLITLSWMSSCCFLVCLNHLILLYFLQNMCCYLKSY